MNRSVVPEAFVPKSNSDSLERLKRLMFLRRSYTSSNSSTTMSSPSSPASTTSSLCPSTTISSCSSSIFAPAGNPNVEHPSLTDSAEQWNQVTEPTGPPEPRADRPTQTLPKPSRDVLSQRHVFQLTVLSAEYSLCSDCVNLLTIFTPASHYLTCWSTSPEKEKYIAVGPQSGYEDNTLACCLCSRIRISQHGHFVRYGYKEHVAEVNSLRVYTELGDPVACKVLGRPVRTHGGDTRVLQLARDWVDDCLKNHPECRSPVAQDGSPPRLPTRVIDVGTSNIRNPRLLRSEGRRGAWVALSHCWGKQPFLTALSSNIDALQSRIWMSSLPATFRNAIIVTRKLGIRYLWIDSLCILQDSREDWQREAASMPYIFRNAHSVIAAAATESSKKGFLVEREWKASSTPYPVYVKSPFEKGFGIVYFDNHFFRDRPREDINTLANRAWCFQEISLSHRLITFDKLQMSFTCLKHGLSEHRDVNDPVGRDEKNLFLSRFQEQLAKNDERRSRMLLNTWYDLLADYTRRSLTKPNDKLVAIAGIANVVGECFQSEYYVGLWQKFLPQSLLWSPYDEETLPNSPHRATMPEPYRAPSWSWASVESPISCFICRETFLKYPISQVLEINTTLVSPDKYGQVKDGHIVIKGPIKLAFVGPALDIWPQQPRIVLPAGMGYDPDDISHYVFDIEPPDKGTEVWCLQITDIYGLALEECPGAEQAYRRIGIFHLRHQFGPECMAIPWFTRNDVRVVKIV